jgi:hypothetical protein
VYLIEDVFLLPAEFPETLSDNGFVEGVDESVEVEDVLDVFLEEEEVAGLLVELGEEDFLGVEAAVEFLVDCELDFEAVVGVLLVADHEVVSPEAFGDVLSFLGAIHLENAVDHQHQDLRRGQVGHQHLLGRVEDQVNVLLVTQRVVSLGFQSRDQQLKGGLALAASGRPFQRLLIVRMIVEDNLEIVFVVVLGPIFAEFDLVDGFLFPVDLKHEDALLLADEEDVVMPIHLYAKDGAVVGEQFFAIGAGGAEVEEVELAVVVAEDDDSQLGLEVGVLDGPVFACFAGQVERASQLRFAGGVELLKEEVALGGGLRAVVVAEQKVAHGMDFDLVGGHFDRPRQLELAVLIVVPQQMAALGAQQLVEHLLALEVKPPPRSQGSSLSHL